jgi:hypothetical protein
MLEPKSYYFPDENPKPARGWKVSAKVAYEPMKYPGGLDNPWNYQDHGCAGFSSRWKAEAWRDMALADGYIPSNAVVTIFYRH